MVRGVAPFQQVHEHLQKLQDKADMIVVSVTNSETLRHKWGEHGIAQYMAAIAGQDMGAKSSISSGRLGENTRTIDPGPRRCAG